jgi:thioesterase domain-containing protein
MTLHTTEAALAAVWTSVTGAGPTPEMDRLDLLPALPVMHLLVEVEAQLGLRVPFECFFRDGMRLGDLPPVLEPRTPSSQVVVPIQPRGGRAPLFFVHGDEYAMLSLRHLAPALGGEQPLVGLLPERVNRRFDRARGLDGMVPALVRALREVQPRGPYHLCGHSLGGVVAYEMAGRLAADGEEVAWLALADTQTPAALRRFYADLMSPVNRLRRQLRRGPARMVAKAWEIAGRRFRGEPVQAAGDLPAAAFDHEGARAVYEASDVTGHDLPVDLYVTTDGMQMSRSEYLGWDAVHRGILTRHEAPGDHMTMLSEPNVTVLSRMMAARLAQVGRRAAYEAVGG